MSERGASEPSGTMSGGRSAAARVDPASRRPTQACNGRAADVDWGEVQTSSIWACYGVRAAYAEGPRDAVHPDALEVSWVERGCERIWARGRETDVRAGQYSLTAPGVVHRSAAGRSAVVGLSLHVSTALLEEVSDELGLRRSDWCSEPHRASPTLLGTLAALRAAALSPSPNHDMIDAMALYLGGELLRRHRGPASSAFRSAGSEAALERALLLMHARLDRALDLDELADAAGLSRFRFAHVFRERHGISPYAYHRRLRLDRAAEAVRSTSTPLTRIALDHGFGTSSRFSDAFRKTWGVSPSRFRRAAGIERAGKNSTARVPASAQHRA